MFTWIEMLKLIELLFFPKHANNRLVRIAGSFISSNMTTFIKGRFILELEIGIFQPMHACIMVHWSCLHLGVTFLLSLDILAPYNGTLRVYIYVFANQLYTQNNKWQQVMNKLIRSLISYSSNFFYPSRCHGCAYTD